MKRTLGLIAGAVAAALLAGCGGGNPITSATTAPSTPFPPQIISEYAVPTANSGAAGITLGPDGALWFTEQTADKIGTLTTTAKVVDFPVPTANAKPEGIAVGADKALWFAEAGAAKIGKYEISTASFGEIPLTAGAQPNSLALGSDGNMWVTDPGLSAVWQVTPQGGATSHPVTGGSGPGKIVLGPDGALWFVETTGNAVGKITTTGTIALQEFHLAAGSTPISLTAGSDNALWVIEQGTNKLARITTAGALTNEFPLTGVQKGTDIVLGVDGNFYITDYTGNQIAQFAPSTQKISLFPDKTANAGPLALTIGPGNAIFLTEFLANNLAQFRYF